MKALDKELTERDALYRIKWDYGIAEREYVVHYIDRGSDELGEISFGEIELAGDFFAFGDSLIPMHRIRKITCKGKIVWNRRRV